MAERLNTLDAVRAALADLRNAASITTFARDVQIAPATLRKLLTWTETELTSEFERWMGRDAGGATNKGSAEPTGLSPKAISGRAESVGRVFSFLVSKNRGPGIDVEQFAKLFALDPKVSQVSQGLRKWKSWAKPPDDPYVSQGDRTIKRIITGEGERPPNVVRAGILMWSPYCDERNNINSSFAGRITTRLLGSLDPLKWGPPELKPLEFHEILNADMLRNGEVDAIFSLYDLPSRRVAGFEFIAVPGLLAPLDAIAFYSSKDVPQGVTWPNILDPMEVPALQMFVVRGDAGHLLVRGACGYLKEQVTDIAAKGDSVTLLDAITERLVEEAKRYCIAREEVVRGTSLSPPRPFVFIADADMVAAVVRRFRDRVARTTPDLPQMAHEVDAHNDRPRYPIGIAVSANSERWRNMLEDTLIRELFVNAGPQTARQYAEMLAMPSKVCVGPLGDLIPPSTRARFSKDVQRELQEIHDGYIATSLQVEALKSHITNRIDNIKVDWY